MAVDRFPDCKICDIQGKLNGEVVGDHRHPSQVTGETAFYIDDTLYMSRLDAVRYLRETYETTITDTSDFLKALPTIYEDLGDDGGYGR